MKVSPKQGAYELCDFARPTWGTKIRELKFYAENRSIRYDAVKSSRVGRSIPLTEYKFSDDFLNGLDK
jgi:hypothetical protein